MDHNQIMQNLVNGGILLVGKRIEPCCLGSFSHLSQSQRNSLSQKMMESAASLSPYDTLELNYGDQKLVLYRVQANIVVLTLNSPRLGPQIIETLLPLIREMASKQNIEP